jgi:hypothetical protein
MASRKGKEPAAPSVQFLPGFKPLSCLWEGVNPPCPSEDSARWEIRKLRPELGRAQALAIHRGRTLIHLERYLRVAEQVAIRKGSGDVYADDQDGDRTLAGLVNSGPIGALDHRAGYSVRPD